MANSRDPPRVRLGQRVHTQRYAAHLSSLPHSVDREPGDASSVVGGLVLGDRAASTGIGRNM